MIRESQLKCFFYSNLFQRLISSKSHQYKKEQKKKKRKKNDNPIYSFDNPNVNFPNAFKRQKERKSLSIVFVIFFSLSLSLDMKKISPPFLKARREVIYNLKKNKQKLNEIK